MYHVSSRAVHIFPTPGLETDHVCPYVQCLHACRGQSVLMFFTLSRRRTTEASLVQKTFLFLSVDAKGSRNHICGLCGSYNMFPWLG